MSILLGTYTMEIEYSNTQRETVKHLLNNLLYIYISENWVPHCPHTAILPGQLNAGTLKLFVYFC